MLSQITVKDNIRVRPVYLPSPLQGEGGGGGGGGGEGGGKGGG